MVKPSWITTSATDAVLKNRPLACAHLRVAARTLLLSSLFGFAPPYAIAATLEDARLSIRTKQYTTAQKQLTELARAGDLDAQYMLASLYRNGTGIKRDYEKSIYWFTQASEKEPDAAYQLGVLHETGKGVIRNREKAVEWYTLAASKGSEKAQKKLDRIASQQANIATAMSTDVLIKYIRSNDTFALKKSLSSASLIDRRDLLNSVDDSGYTALIFAIEKNNSEVTNVLLNAGASPNKKNSFGDTPLTFAAGLGFTAIAKTLIDAGANINLQDDLKNTPLHIAVDKDDLAFSKLLLARGANPNLTNKKAFTALDYADNEKLTALLVKNEAKAGQLSVLTAPQSELSDEELAENIARQGELLAEGDNPFTNWPALNIAAWRGQKKQAEILLKQKDIDIESLDEGGLTPLARAAWQGHTDIVQQLIASNADVNFLSAQGETPLALAVTSNHAAIAEQLLALGATTERLDTNLEPLLNMAARKGFDSLALAMAKQTADVDITHNGKTPLMWAAEKGNQQLLKELLTHKLDVNKTDNTQRTALWLAADTNNILGIKALLEAGADTTLAGALGNTPLAQAIKKGHTQLAMSLATPSSVINKANKQGNTPLILAAQGGYTDIANMLLKAGADLEIRNKNSFTAFLLAAQSGQSTMVTFLIEAGADSSRRTRNGNSAIDLAEASNHTQVVEILKKEKSSFF